MTGIENYVCCDQMRANLALAAQEECDAHAVYVTFDFGAWCVVAASGHVEITHCPWCGVKLPT